MKTAMNIALAICIGFAFTASAYCLFVMNAPLESAAFTASALFASLLAGK